MKTSKLHIKNMIEILIVYFLFVLGYSLIYRKYIDILPNEIFGLNAHFSFYIFLFSVVTLVLVKLLNTKSKWKDYGFRKPRKWNNLFMAFFMLMPVALLGRIFDPEFDPWYAGVMGLNVIPGVMFFISTLPFFVIKEEIIERSIFQSRIQKAYGLLITLFSVSINFALAHFFIIENGIKHMFWQSFSVFFGSFVLVFFYFLNKDLIQSIILHLLYNVVIVWQIYFHVTNLTYEMIFWALFGIGFLFYVRKFYKMFTKELHKHKVIPKLHVLDWMFIAIFSVILPIIMIFLINQI